MAGASGGFWVGPDFNESITLGETFDEELEDVVYYSGMNFPEGKGHGAKVGLQL